MLIRPRRDKTHQHFPVYGRNMPSKQKVADPRLPSSPAIDFQFVCQGSLKWFLRAIQTFANFAAAASEVSEERKK